MAGGAAAAAAGGGAAAAATGSHPPGADVLQPSSLLQSWDAPQGPSRQTGREQWRRRRGGADLCEGRSRLSLGGRECVPRGCAHRGTGNNGPCRHAGRTAPTKCGNERAFL